MNFAEMTLDAVEARLAEIATEKDNEGADLDALTVETRGLIDRRNELKAEARKAELDGVLNGDVASKTVVTFETEERGAKTMVETRNTSEYIEQFAEYIKTEKRGALLTTNANGSVAVPTLVEDIIKTAWDNDGIMSLVKKAELKGNVKIGFEISGTDAVIHTEGTDAPAEETLTLGIVELVPQSIKKWITISDEVMDLRGEAFLRYIYKELAYKIIKKCADVLISKIEAKPSASTATEPGVAVVKESAITMGTIANALAELSDEAVNPVIVMNKKSYGAFKAVQYANNYGVDVFEGLKVYFNDTIKPFATASANDTYAIVGDFENGALANMPNGDEVTFKFDENTLAEKDLVKVVAREFVAVDVIAPKHFVKVQK